MICLLHILIPVIPRYIVREYVQIHVNRGMKTIEDTYFSTALKKNVIRLYLRVFHFKVEARRIPVYIYDRTV